MVNARNVGFTAVEATDTIPYVLTTVIPPATGVTLDASPVSPSPVSTLITLTAGGEGGGGAGTYEYRFWIFDGAGWSPLRGWSDVASAPWTPVTPGTYVIQADVRTIGSTSEREAINQIIYVVDP